MIRDDFEIFGIDNIYTFLINISSFRNIFKINYYRIIIKLYINNHREWNKRHLISIIDGENDLKLRNEEKRRRATKGAKDPRSLSAPTLLFVIIYKVVILRIRARIDFYVDEFMRVPDGGRRVAVVRP